ncbi:MAG: gliding motility protein GldM [Flavobacteriaceae bacterium]|nr:gliding motility protein GldM [Flavobacteriaceae bacterium]
MASAKLSPRQKMINLMYLVFIAMLALNVSKEVISAFGVMNERLEESNTATSSRNDVFMAGLELKAQEQPAKYADLRDKAKQINVLTNEFYSYIENLKITAKKTVDDPKDYEVMDKSNFLDERFFNGDRLEKDGKEFLQKMADYKNGVKGILGGTYPDVQADINAKFSTERIKNRDGKSIEYLEYHYKGFPLIASLAKFSQLQSDAKNAEYQILSKMLQGELTEQVDLNNFKTLLADKKAAYYQGETFNGEIVVGKIDSVSQPERVEISLDGKPLVKDRDFVLRGGIVQLKVPSGNAGDHKITGTLFFQQDGIEAKVSVDQTYSVIAKPKEAVISADKMNVVYRGVDNPITISMPGVPTNKINVNATGLQGVGGSAYVMRPGAGRAVTISVVGEIDGQKIPTSKEFRIKDIPRPTGTIRGEDGSVQMQRNSLEISTVGAQLFDFDFDLTLNVTGFKFKVPGQPTIQVAGNKLDARAKSALSRAVKGDIVQIFDIQANLAGNSSYLLKKISPVLIELTN